jgi:superoxide dismutase, Fe-Mn family
MAFTLPDLPYAHNALEPFIDARTMEIHHSKHHAAYVTNLNKALENNTEAQNATIETICKNVSKYPVAVRNNGGGHYNHSLFWKLLKKNENGQAGGVVREAIDRDLGGWDKFKETFAQAATTRFGSGWAWLILKDDNSLVVASTANQDNPLMDVAEVKGTPILGLDVWEHAYYLNYQNRRPDYIAAFWNVINWDEVGTLYQQARK